MNWPWIFPPLMLVAFLSILSIHALYNLREMRRLRGEIEAKRAAKREAAAREAERDGVQTDLPLRRTGSA